ncbi:hypothetical protein [Halorubrum sp. DTA46]|uniref:hypothetical protein n=1 Tax=Halorubrum sp. DTA46 TaxID=3402162 RepID=UPI003AAAFCC2
MTAVARYFDVDEDLEAGFVVLAGGLLMLGDSVVTGGALIAGGGAVLALSEPTRMRGTGA